MREATARHSSPAGVGLLNMAARVLRCLVFIEKRYYGIVPLSRPGGNNSSRFFRYDLQEYMELCSCFREVRVPIHFSEE